MTRFPHGTPVFLTEDIRRIEALAASQPDKPQLMERAGLAAAELARELGGGTGKQIVVLAGPGNNGGDALVLARHLKGWWFNVAGTFAGDPEASAGCRGRARMHGGGRGSSIAELPSARSARWWWTGFSASACIAS